jgi:hypothetical protein
MTGHKYIYALLVLTAYKITIHRMLDVETITIDQTSDDAFFHSTSMPLQYSLLITGQIANAMLYHKPSEYTLVRENSTLKKGLPLVQAKDLEQAKIKMDRRSASAPR